MKRKLLLISSFILGTLALTTSCSNDSLEQTAPAAKEVTINFGANVGEDTRTVYDPAAAVSVAWQTGDKVRLYDGTSQRTLTVGTVNSDGTTAFPYSATVGSHTFTALYPLSADNGLSTDKLRIVLPNSQTYVAPTATTEGSFDPAADILFAKSIDVDVTEAAAQNIPLVFTRPLAVCQFALKIDDATVNSLDGDKIQSVKISVEATNTKYLTGNFYGKLEDGTIVDGTKGIFYGSEQSYVNLTPDNSDNAVLKIGKPIAVWAVVAPVALESGDKLVFDIVTDKNTIKKEITIGASGLNFVAGSRNTATINLRNATISSASAPTSLTEDFSSLVGDNINSTGSSTTWDGNENFPNVSAAYQAGGAVKIGTGKKSGSITSKPLNLSAAFVVKIKVKGWASVEGDLNVTVGATTKTITYEEKMTDAFGEYTLNFDAATANSTVKIATTAKRAFIDEVQIYPQ